jgi:hypothetical protein
MTERPIGSCSFCGFLRYCTERRVSHRVPPLLICDECRAEERAGSEPVRVPGKPPARETASAQGEMFAFRRWTC